MEYYHEEEVRAVGSSSETNPEETSAKKTKMSVFDTISYYILIALVFLLPVFSYTPFSGFPLDFSKKVILFGGSILAIIFWLIARFEDGSFSFPGGAILKSWILVIFSFALSALFLLKEGGTFGQSIFGIGYETDTLFMMFVMMAVLFLSSVYFQSLKRLSRFYLALIASFLVVFVAEVIQIYMGGKLFTDANMVTNLVGRWNDLGIFFGLGAILSLAALELLELELYPKILVSSVLVLALISLGVVNYSFVWGALAVGSLLILVYSVFFNGLKDGEGFSKLKLVMRPSFVVMIICVVMFFAQAKVGEILSKYNIVNIDVRPSFGATIDIAKNSMKAGGIKSILLGSGPNNFASEWVKYKPDGVNNTIFWNVDFTAGIGRVPTYAITLGLFGILAWIYFLGSMIYLGFKTVMYSEVSKPLRFITFVSFLGTLYLWVFSIAYVTDTVIFTLSFLMMGVFVASLLRIGAIKRFEFSFLSDPRLGFASVLVLVLLVITSISGGYLVGKKFMANYLFQKGVYEMNTKGDLDGGEVSLKSAVEYDEQDIYYRNLSTLNLLKLRKFVSENKVADKEAVTKLQEFIVSASANARKSIDLDQNNYQNWMALGQVGETVVPLKVVDGSYTLALDSYKKALLLNPKSPMILLSMARLEIANNDVEKAKGYLNESLKLKSNFTAALYLLSQIEASQGNLKDAIQRAEEAYLFAPDDLGVLFQLGFLKFTNKDYEGAVASLERATAINPQYSNAKYFLGLGYAKLGKNSAAIKEFKEISALNPDNEEVKNIIKNLTAGRDPFEAAAKEPAKRDKLPVSEE